MLRAGREVGSPLSETVQEAEEDAGVRAAAWRDARRNPQNITAIPTASASEKTVKLPAAAKADPTAAMIVAPRAMPSTP